MNTPVVESTILESPEDYLGLISILSISYEASLEFPCNSKIAIADTPTTPLIHS